MRRLGLSIAVAILLAGCEPDRDGAYLSSGPPVLSPDTSQMAVGIDWSHKRNLTLVDYLVILLIRRDPAAEFGYEILTYDLAHRRGPRRIARWIHDVRESPGIVGWDSAGIVVNRDEYSKVALLERVDPVTGAATRCEVPVGLTLHQWRVQLNETASDRRNRRHVEKWIGGFFLWDPATRRDEFLFALPSVHEGFRDPDSARKATEATRERISAALHDIWEASTLTQTDSVRVFVETYVALPAADSMLYTLSLRLSIPDPPRDTERQSAYQWVPLGHREIKLGPEAAKLQVAVSNRQLQHLVHPYLRIMRRPTWSKVIGSVIEVELHPVIAESETTMMKREIFARAGSSTEVGVRFPVR